MPTLPVQLDLFALLMLLGVAQGLFLGVFFLAGQRGRQLPNRCMGWLMLALSAVIGEIWLCYSNYIMRVLALVDFSEPVNFVLGPLFFLFIFTRIRGRLPWGWGWHFLLAGLWTINAVSWIYQPVEFKYNNFLEAWHPDLPRIAEPPYYLPEDFFGIRDYVNELTLASCLVYSVLALLTINRAYRERGQVIWQRSMDWLSPLRNLSFLFFLVPVLIVIVKLQFNEDLGDYILACYMTGVIYVTSFLVMRGSDFFVSQPQPVAEPPVAEPKKKYGKSSLPEAVEEAILVRLNHLLATSQPYLESDLSLPRLAERLETTPHHLSQLMNDRLGQTFFDWLATHRVAEARRLLADPTLAHLKIDEIAERVGYNSPSAFHTAFKRLTQQTPAQFREGGGLLSTSSRSARTS